MRLNDIPRLLRSRGLEVIEYDRPFGYGRAMSVIRAIVNHDTVTTRGWTDISVANLIKNGRPGVPGPLYQLGLDRQGRFWLFADGRANHNGYGTYGNDAIGIGVFCAGGLKGHEEPYSALQSRNIAIANAVLSQRYSVPVVRVLGHKETDPRRKIDPWGVSMPGIRSATQQALSGSPLPPVSSPGTGPAVEEEEMRRGHPNRSEVRYYQMYLNLYFHGKTGHPAGVKVDGIFGNETHAYTAEFQKREKFSTNGVVTPIMIAILQSRLIHRGLISPSLSVRSRQHDELHAA